MLMLNSGTRINGGKYRDLTAKDIFNILQQGDPRIILSDITVLHKKGLPFKKVGRTTYHTPEDVIRYFNNIGVNIVFENNGSLIRNIDPPPFVLRARVCSFLCLPPGEPLLLLSAPYQDTGEGELITYGFGLSLDNILFWNLLYSETTQIRFTIKLKDGFCRIKDVENEFLNQKIPISITSLWVWVKKQKIENRQGSICIKDYALREFLFKKNIIIQFI